MSINHPDQYPQESHREPTKDETSLKRMVDRGYKAFWARRGKKPPKVSRHYLVYGDGDWPRK